MLHALWYLPTNFITFLGSRQRNLKKCRISAIYQPAEQNLLHVENIYKDTIDLRESSSRAQVPQVQPNYKIMKRMWNALFRRKIVFRFSLQQFETDDGCFFKRRNRVSNLTAQKNFCTIWILVGLQNFWWNFHILGCYKAMDQQAAEPVEPI